jgi:hypothetical protein
MSIWWSDLDGCAEEAPEDGWYHGIFTTPPSLIASVLSRPLPPFLPYRDQNTDEKISCVTELRSNLTPSDLAISSNPTTSPPSRSISAC